VVVRLQGSDPRAATDWSAAFAAQAADEQVREVARAISIDQVMALRGDAVPGGRDRAVGVPMFVCPRGDCLVVDGHSHAWAARSALSAANLPFDHDFPDRTLQAEFGWAAVQVGGHAGVRIQLDRRPTARQRAALEDLAYRAHHAGQPIELWWQHPRDFAGGEWRMNRDHAVARDLDDALGLLERLARD
jgi:hypothetical protein